MKRNSLLALSLIACTLLAGCDKKTEVVEGGKPVGTVTAFDATGKEVKLDTVLDLQTFYENLKTSTGGSEALKQLIEKISYLEYYKDGAFYDRSEEEFSVKSYHTVESFKKDIEEKFQDVLDGNSYNDEDGNFDPEEYKEYVEESLDYEVTDTPSTKYLSAEVANKLVYNYDNYIEESIIPSLLESYIYLDYITASSKYKGQFSNQYAVKLEVLKVPQDTSKENGAWNEAFVRDIRNVVAGTATTFGTTYSFVTFNSDCDLILVESAADGVTYSVYEKSTETDALYDSMFKLETGADAVKQVKFDVAKAAVASLTAKETAKIDATSTTNQEFYETVEKILIARDLWNVDREVVLAVNYDYDSPWYKTGMTEAQKTEASGFASSYTASNAKPLRDVVKSKKITTQQAKYYTEPDYYTKGTYSNVLPSALSSLRGTSAKELISHLYSNWAEGDQFLLPKEAADPLYLDVSSNTYYVCEVYEWYGYYKNENIYSASSKYKSISNYQIDAYQNGSLTEYVFNADSNAYTVQEGYPLAYKATPAAFESTIELVQISANAILTTAMKKEAIIALFTKYGLEINDQEIHDYIKEQYPDYFAAEND